MKTAPWIDLLAQGAGPTAQRLVPCRLAPVAVLGAPGSAAIAVAWLGWVPIERFLTAALRLRLASAAALAASAGRLTARLAHPVARLAAPVLAGLPWAWRGLAPTRPRTVGAGAGLLAGAPGAAGYALACTEDCTASIAVWYSAGIAVTGGMGAALGPRVLRG